MGSGKLFLILGPSGSGKGVVIDRLKKQYPHFVFPVSCTTRKPRPLEREGDVYHFISEDEFQRRIDAGEFLEWAKIHLDHYYGTLKKPILEGLASGKILIREVDVQGMLSLKKIFSRDELVTIFLTTPSWEILKTRIQRRHKESQKDLEKRYQSYEKEVQFAKECDYIVHSFEGHIPKMVDEIASIIAKETR